MSRKHARRAERRQTAAAIDIQVVPITDEVDAWLVEDHTNPLITLKFGFEGGSRWDEPGKEGTTSLAFGSLNEGAGEMNAETFLGLLQDEAVSMAGSAGSVRRRRRAASIGRRAKEMSRRAESF